MSEREAADRLARKRLRGAIRTTEMLLGQLRMIEGEVFYDGLPLDSRRSLEYVRWATESMARDTELLQEALDHVYTRRGEGGDE